VAKDSSRITDGELQRLLEGFLKGQEAKKIKNQHHHMFGKVSRKILLAHLRTNSSKFRCQT